MLRRNALRPITKRPRRAAGAAVIWNWQAYRMFSMFDCDGSGRISKDEWSRVLVANGFRLVIRPGNARCHQCMDKGIAETGCASKKEEWKERCTETLWDQCATQDCMEKDHPCQMMSMVDHRVHPQAWRVMADRKFKFYRDPSRICVDKIFIDKLKQVRQRTATP